MRFIRRSSRSILARRKLACSLSSLGISKYTSTPSVGRTVGTAVGKEQERRAGSIYRSINQSIMIQSWLNVANYNSVQTTPFNEPLLENRTCGLIKQIICATKWVPNVMWAWNTHLRALNHNVCELFACFQFAFLCSSINKVSLWFGSFVLS